MKIILLVLVLLIIYVLFFKKKKIDKVKKDNMSIGDEIMINCAKCDTYISNQDAIIKDGRFYCSKECAGVN
jgi:uncharacterized protein